MKQLTHWNPFKTLARQEPSSGFDEYFRNFGMSPLLSQIEVPDIRLDVSETDKAYTIKADIPGAKKEDIDVSVDGRQVTISATMSRKTEKKGESSLYTERSEGQVYRSFTLPTEVDNKSAQAHYENGVLDLMLPKKSNGNERRLKIS